MLTRDIRVSYWEISIVVSQIIQVPSNECSKLQPSKCSAEIKWYCTEPHALHAMLASNKTILLKNAQNPKTPQGLFITFPETHPSIPLNPKKEEMKYRVPLVATHTHLINSSSGRFVPSSETRLRKGERGPATPRNCASAYQLPTKTKVPSPTKTHSRCDPAFPMETIRNASKECQDEAPRWWNNGVSTSPFRAWRFGFLLVPERIRSSDLSFWRAWMVLLKLVS